MPQNNKKKVLFLSLLITSGLIALGYQIFTSSDNNNQLLSFLKNISSSENIGVVAK